ETEALQLLRERNRERLTLAHPDVPSPEVDTYKIWCGHAKREEIEELDLTALYAFMDEYRQKTGEDPDPHKTWVIALDTQGEAKTQKTALWRYLVGHIEHDGHIYVLSLEQWYRTDRDYLAELRAKVSRIEDATAILNLPSWPRNQNEDEYNRQAAEMQKWLLLDRTMFTFGAPTDKIECADLLTPDRDFIHVKSMTSSATLSHLFSQGTVSARLLRTTDEYRHRVEAEYRSKYGKDFDTQSGSRVVYAIATAKEGPISENLFFFSLVNLVLHQEMLAAMGLPVAVCRIRRETS
ncbi:MAG: TIGR04141 family sporadically distributed protein, partial [Anaerolineales bacterium]|nr:TIGR04141 family sporadically distributed protein [Anaerolineales bacterium]